MDTENEENIAIVFDALGMIELFGSAIYSDPGAMVRELIQNAHDATKERAAHLHGDGTGSANDFIEGSRIDLYQDYRIGALIVEDNGIGMSREDMKVYLNNFGISNKSLQRLQALKREQGTLSPTVARNLIGRYGVGLLSSLANGDAVEIVSVNEAGAIPTVWRYSKGDTKFGLTSVAPQAPPHYHLNHQGTRVVVYLGDSAKRFLLNHPLEELAKKYGLILRPPIFADKININPSRHIWNEPKTAKSSLWEEFLKKELSFKPSFVKSLCHIDENGDRIVAGAIFVPERSGFSFRRDVRVFVHRMRVESDSICAELLPNWARFLGMVVDSDYLERQVSGESFIRNPRYEQVVSEIAKNVVTLLKEIAEDKEVFDSVLGEYDDELKTACLESPELMRTLGPYSRIKVVGGARLTLSDYQRRVAQRLGRQKDDLLYAFDDPGEEATAQVLAQGTQIPIINAVYGTDRAFLRQYSKQAGVSLSGLDKLADEHFKERPDVEQRYKRVLRMLVGLQIEGRIRSFSPKSVPAILTFGRDQAHDKEAFKQVLLAAAEAGHLSSSFVEDQLYGGAKHRQVQLYLNAENETIQDLADTTIPDADLDLVLRSLYHSAFMFNYRSLRDDETDAIFRTTTAVIGRLVKVSSPPGECRKEQRAILATDLVGSTPLQSVLGPAAFSEFLSIYAAVLFQWSQRRNGKFVSFTGDGAFVAFDVQNLEGARRFASQIGGVLDEVIDAASESLRKDLQTYCSSVPNMRTVITFGNVHVGVFGGQESVIGYPMIEAARILEEKALFQRASDTLITSDFRTPARIPDNQCEIVKNDFEVRGTGRKINLFRLR